MDQAISELQLVHEYHIQKLKDLHESELAELQTALSRSRQQCEQLTQEKTRIEGEVEGMRTEVEMLRQSFDLVQGRLKRVLVDQDDLVKLLQLVDAKTTDKEPRIELPALNQTKNITELELVLKSQVVQDESTAAALQAIKYYKKLEASDPAHLCRLLEISFDPARSFALSTSLLQSIAVHMTEDPVATKALARFPLYRLLLREIVRLRQEENEICRVFLGNTKKSCKSIVTDISRRIRECDLRDKDSECDRREKAGSRSECDQKETICKWLIDEYASGNSDNDNHNSILTSFLSTFNL